MADRRRDYWFSFKDSCVVVRERVPFQSEGTRQVLLMVHGRFGAGPVVWTSLMELILPHSRVLIPDLPGFGQSFVVSDRGFGLLESAELIQKIIEELCLPAEQVILVGHDTGGALAQICAFHMRERVSALILINSACLFRDLVVPPLCWRGGLTPYWINKMIRLSPGLDLETRVLLRNPWRRFTSRFNLVRSIRAFEKSWPLRYERDYWRTALAGISQPVLLILGKKDPMIQMEFAEVLMARVPQAELFCETASGHWPHLEHPARVLDTIRTFLTRSCLLYDRQDGPRIAQISPWQ